MKNYGSVYLRKDGYYYGRVMYQGIKKSFYGKSKESVQDKLNDFVMTCKYNNVSANNSVNFSVYIENYLYTYKYGFIKDSSYDRLESILNCQIRGTSIDISVYNLTDVLVQQYLNSKRDCSVSVLKKIYNLVRSVLAYAYRKKDLEYDIASLLTLPKSNKSVKHIDVYSDEEVSILEKEIKRILMFSNDKRETKLFRYSPAFIIMLNTGLRASEMLALTWDNVDLVKNKIHVCQSLSHIKNRDESEKSYTDVIGSLKTDKSYRDIPINDTARECFLYLKMNSASDYVVDNGKGSFLLLRSFQQTFGRVCVHVGIESKGLHALRHTFASRLIALEVPPKVVSDLLGHTSVVFTLNRYVHTYDNNLEDAVSLLSQEKGHLSGNVSGNLSGNKKES